MIKFLAISLIVVASVWIFMPRTWSKKDFSHKIYQAQIFDSVDMLGPSGSLKEAGHSFIIQKDFEKSNDQLTARFPSLLQSIFFKEIEIFAIFSPHSIKVISLYHSNNAEQSSVIDFDFSNKEVTQTTRNVLKLPVSMRRPQFIWGRADNSGNRSNSFGYSKHNRDGRFFLSLLANVMKKMTRLESLSSGASMGFVSESIPLSSDLTKWSYSEFAFGAPVNLQESQIEASIDGDIKTQGTNSNHKSDQSILNEAGLDASSIQLNHDSEKVKEKSLENSPKILELQDHLRDYMIVEQTKILAPIRFDHRKLKALQTRDGMSYGLVLQERAQENTSLGDYFFLNNQGTVLHPVLFKYDPLNWNNSMRFSTYDKQLKLESAPGTLDFTFAPLGSIRADLDLKILQKDTSFVFGVLEGYVVDKNGVKHEISDFQAVFESTYFKL